MNTYNKLWAPLKLNCGVTLKNRVVMAPMTARQSFENGMITTDEIAYYERRAKGVAMLVTACAYVTEDGRAFKGGPSIANDETVAGHKKLASAIKAQGAKAVLQIFHGGRNVPPDAIACKQPVSASAVASVREGSIIPRELTADEVAEIVKAFGEATRRAIEAGYEGVEIHGANTYLIQQFFSPQSNVRDDQWGGSLVGRMQFPLAVARTVCEAVEKYAKKPFIVGYRISPEEKHTPGITLKDTEQLLKQLVKFPIDYVHVSLQDVWQSSIREQNNEKPVLLHLQDILGYDVPLIGVGGIWQPAEANQVVEQGIPLVALGRALIVEPDWVKKAMSGREADIRLQMSVRDREELAISYAMWAYLARVPGWLPIVD